MPKIFLINKTETKDITQVVSKITWSGSISEAARKSEISIVTSPTDYYLPKIDIQLGNLIKIIDDNENELFQGYVFFREKSYNSNEMTITAYDGLIYLLKSKGTYNIKNMTAEGITQKLCEEFNVPVNNIVNTGIPQSRIFENTSIYDIIMTMYTNASKQNGKLYRLSMQEGKLNVIEFGSIIATKTINYLIDSKYSESLENMINKVKIYDENKNYIDIVENSDDISNYGVLQEVYTKEKDKDMYIVAKNMLKGIEQTGSIETLGNVECITGNAVNIKDTYTGLVGTFWIKSDTHTWEGNQYKMSLELDFKAIMDEKNAGEV